MTARCAPWDGPEFHYLPGFLARPEADRLFQDLWAGLDWEQREIVLFGRRRLQPRLVAWYGDSGAAYRYSGVTLQPRPWPPTLRAVRRRVEQQAGCAFNSVLANAYRDGADSMGWHSDDEPELGPRPCIASLSLGAARVFLLRPRGREPGVRRTSSRRVLEHGSLLLMRGDSQARFQHAVPKTRRPVGVRINLTFRFVQPRAR
jgi:alkylated DNA repair dioxygenase AlkB